MTWAVLIYAAATLVGVASGITMARWEIYGSTIDVAVKHARMARLIAYGVVGTLLYWRLAAPVQQRFLHVAATFLFVQLIDVAVSLFMFGVPAAGLLGVWSLVRSATAALVGLGLANALPSRLAARE